MSTPFVLASCNEFIAHWICLAAPRMVPHTTTFVDNITPLVRDALILELLPDGTFVRFMGSGLVSRWQQDFTGAHLEQVIAAPDQTRFRKHVEAVCHYPAGLRARDEVRTSSGRKIEYEMVVLPLAVDADKPPRCVVYRGMLAPLDWRESKKRFCIARFRYLDKSWLGHTGSY